MTSAQGVGPRLATIVHGLAIGHDVSIPFLYDFAVFAPFLVAIPLLIMAEGLIERHIAGVMERL